MTLMFPTRQTTWMVGLKKFFFQPLYDGWKGRGNTHELTPGEQRTKHFRKRGSLVKLLDPAGACGLQCHSLVCISAH